MLKKKTGTNSGKKPEHFKALTKNCEASAIADHITSTVVLYPTVTEEVC